MELSPPPLASRYRFLRGVRHTHRAVVWLAVDLQTERKVVVLAQPSKGDLPAQLARIRHPHLAAVLDVLADVDPAWLPPGKPIAKPRVLIAEHVPGASLREKLRLRRMSPLDAAVSFARVASALHELHSAHCTHGAVTCDNIVAEPSSPAQGPVLTQLIGLPGAAYCSPERAAGQGPSAADDVWALHAALFVALTRTVPYPGSTLEEMRANVSAGKLRNPRDLGVRDPELQSILERGLLIDPDLRRRDARELEKALTSWADQQASAAGREATTEVEEAETDDEVETQVMSAEDLPGFSRAGTSLPEVRPSPLPDAPPSADSDRPADPIPVVDAIPALVAKPALSSAPPPWAVAREQPTRPPAPRASPRSRAGLWLAGLTVPLVLAIGAGAFLAPRRIARLIARGPASQASTASVPQGDAAGAARTTSTSARTGAEASRDGGPSQAVQDGSSPPAPQDLRACVASFFEDGTFHHAVPPDLGYLCEDRDVRELTANVLHTLVVNGVGNTTPGMRVWSTLGWYELAATALVRARCCPAGSPAIRVPAAPAPCKDQLPDALAKLSTTVPKAGDGQALAEAFAQGVTCYYANGVPRPYYYRGAPDKYAREQFVRFVERAAARSNPGAMGRPSPP